MIVNTLNIDKTIWLQSLKMKTTVHIISFCRLIGFIIKYSTNVLVQWIYVVFIIHKHILPLFTILIIFRRTFVLRLFSGLTLLFHSVPQLLTTAQQEIYMNENSVAFGNITKLIHIVFSSVTIIIFYLSPTLCVKLVLYN